MFRNFLRKYYNIRIPFRVKAEIKIPLAIPEVIIYRETDDDQGTYGILETRSGFCCHTIELPNRNNATNVSRIPAGLYKCKIHHSPRHGYVFHLQDVQGRTWILIHTGNLAGDLTKGWKTHSAGCILLGKYRGRLSKQKAVMCSKTTVRDFAELMDGKEFLLEIKE